jgi:hypothetical protein
MRRRYLRVSRRATRSQVNRLRWLLSLMTRTEPRNLSFPGVVDYRWRTIRRPLEILGQGCRPDQEGKPKHAGKIVKDGYETPLKKRARPDSAIVVVLRPSFSSFSLGTS